MVRNRIRKTDIGMHSEDKIKEGIDLIAQGTKIREAAKNINVPYTTLYRYYKKFLKNEENMRFNPNYENRKIFTSSQEQALVDYIIKCSQMFYGLNPVDVRKLAYQMACKNNVSVPQKWHETQMAGVDWLYHFRKRHSILSLRTPEGCSLSRATSFNRHNVKIFFDNLHNVMQRQTNFGNGTRVFNLDETNTSTVQKSGKVLAVRGQKQVSKVTSAEKGTTVTTCYIVNALGHALPPIMIFPRVHFKQHMIAGAPTGTLGLATPSGWMNSKLFIETMQHFINHTQSSKDNPSLLIMDNFEAHICIDAINLAKENGVTILTVPPHSTGKLQPLDVAIFKPFKLAYNAAVDSWLMRNPGKTFTIYEVAQCIKEAHMKAMTPANICRAFESTGIYPFNRDIFTDLDFAPSEVTDREIEELVPLVNDSASSSRCPLRSEAIERIIDAIPESSDERISPSLLISQNPLSRNMSPSLEDATTSRSSAEPRMLPLPQSPLSRTPSPFLKNLTSDRSSIQCKMSSLAQNTLPIFTSASLEDPITSDLYLLSKPPSPIQNLLPRTPSPALERPIASSSQVQSATPLNPRNLLSSNPSTSSEGPIIPVSKTPPPAEHPGTSKQFISPFDFRGLPKAGPRKSERAPRRKGKSMVATDTPNKLEIERNAEMAKKKNKEAAVRKRKVLQESKSQENTLENLQQNKKKRQGRTITKVKNKKRLQSGSSEEENDYMSVHSEEEAGYEDESEEELFEISENFVPLDSQPKEGDYILVEFLIGNKKVFYLAKVIGERNQNEMEVSYLRKCSKIKNAFQLPNVPDIATVFMEDIKMILPKPAFSGGTKRQQGIYKFDLDFSKIDLR